MARRTHVPAILACLAALTFGCWSATAAANNPAGQLEISVLQGDGWHKVATVSPGRDLEPHAVRIPGVTSGPTKVRIHHVGATNTHLDVVTLGGQSPRAIRGSLELPALGLKKLERADFDVIELTGRSVELTFDACSGPAALELSARIEPTRITKQPFQYPAANLFKPVTSRSSFYTYRLGSSPGRLRVDGDLRREALGRPLFQVYSRTGTGHPSANTYGWVKSDGRKLYVALDFVPDNTMDGLKDYAAVHVATPTGVKHFRASVAERRWGRAGFVYTPRAGYQHKVYEFAIPLAEAGLAGLKDGDPIKLAFAAYGTAAPDVGPEAGPDQAVPDQAAVTPDQAQVTPDIKTSADVTPVKPDAATPKEDEPEGCDCSVSPQPLAAWPLLLVALGLILRRRCF